MLKTFTALTTLMAGTVTPQALAQTLTIAVDVPAGHTGTLMLGVFASQAAFDAGDLVMGLSQPATTGLNQITVANLPSGTYGISVFLDGNGDGKLNRNLVGAPTEPYGFTQNPRIRFSAPKFTKFSFDYDGQDAAMTIELNGL